MNEIRPIRTVLFDCATWDAIGQVAVGLDIVLDNHQDRAVVPLLTLVRCHRVENSGRTIEASCLITARPISLIKAFQSGANDAAAAAALFSISSSCFLLKRNHVQTISFQCGSRSSDQNNVERIEFDVTVVSHV